MTWRWNQAVSVHKVKNKFLECSSHMKRSRFLCGKPCHRSQIKRHRSFIFYFWCFFQGKKNPQWHLFQDFVVVSVIAHCTFSRTKSSCCEPLLGVWKPQSRGVWVSLMLSDTYECTSPKPGMQQSTLDQWKSIARTKPAENQTSRLVTQACCLHLILTSCQETRQVITQPAASLGPWLVEGRGEIKSHSKRRKRKKQHVGANRCSAAVNDVTLCCRQAKM